MTDTKEKHACYRCKTTFTNLIDLHNHQEQCKTWVCGECGKSSSTLLESQKHQWRTHPTSDAERAWARAEKNGFKDVSTFYQDDPWY